MQTPKSLHWEFSKNNDKIALRLTGELSRDTLRPLWLQRSSFLPRQENIDFDLQAVTRIDSAGFALLCNLIHDSRTQQAPSSKVIVKNPPVQLMTLAELFGLSEWLKPFIQFDGTT